MLLVQYGMSIEDIVPLTRQGCIPLLPADGPLVETLKFP